MGVLERQIRYDKPYQLKDVIVRPEASGWLKAAGKDISIIVGALDLEEQPARPGHRGKTRIDLARNWVLDMKALARSSGQSANLKLKIIPGIGHNSRRLTPHCKKALF